MSEIANDIVKVKIPESIYLSTYASYKIRDISADEGNFMIDDIVGIINDKNLKIDRICEILLIHVDPNDRGHDYGTKLLAKILKSTNDEDYRTIYLLRSGPLTLDYPTMPDEETYDKELVNQATWLERHGFRNINSVCGFDQSIPYLYLNDAATEIDENGNSLLKEIIYTYEIKVEPNSVVASENVTTNGISSMSVIPNSFIKMPKELGETLVEKYIKFYSIFVGGIRELDLGENATAGFVEFDVLREIGDKNIKLWDEGVSIKAHHDVPVPIFSAGIVVNTGCTWANDPNTFISIRDKLRAFTDETARMINPDYDEYYNWHNTDSDRIVHTLIGGEDNEYFFELEIFVPDPNMSYAHEEDNRKIVIALVLLLKPGKYFMKENENNG